MCNCHKEQEELLREEFQQQLPPGAEGLSVKLQGYVLSVGGGKSTLRAACKVEIQFQAPKKARGMKYVKQKTYLRATYCPFCGEKYPE